MSANRHYDTVAFDVRENATLLFFARTGEQGEIEDYLLLMRAVSDDFDNEIFLEVNEQQLSISEIIREVEMQDCMLTLRFRMSVEQLGGTDELVLTFDGSAENRTSMEAGAFRVLGDKLTGGHA